MNAKTRPTKPSLGQLLDLYVGRPTTLSAAGKERPTADTRRLFAAIAAEHFADWRDRPPDRITLAMLDRRWGVVLAKVAGRAAGDGRAMTLLAFGLLASACREGLDRHLIEHTSVVTILDFVRTRRRIYRGRSPGHGRRSSP